MQPVFRKSRIDAYAACMADLAQRAGDRWQAGQAIDLSDEMMRLTLSIAAKSLFDHDIAGDSDVISHNLETLLEYFTRLMSPFLSLTLALPLPSTRRFRGAVRDLDEVIYRMIRQRAASPSEGDDLLGLLMRATDDETRTQMTPRQLRDELVTLMIAGHETSANVISWTLYRVARDPEVDRLLHEEADALLAGRKGFEAADAERLPYARQVLSEGLRMYPPGWFIGREALADVSLCGWTIPKGGVVLMSQYLMQRDPRFYDAPEEFRPSRWTRAFMDGLPRGAFFPFSGGDRHCIGEGFAWQEVLLIVATLLQRWRFEPADERPVAPRPSVTLRPDIPIRMRVRAR
jgi:cytochrome P450